MNLPCVIDNRAHILADVLNDLLGSDAVHAPDVATASFNVGGFDLVRGGLENLVSCRLLLGSEPGGERGCAHPFGAIWARLPSTGRRCGRWKH